MYFTLVYSQIWLNRSRDARHFFDIFLGIIVSLTAQKISWKTPTSRCKLHVGSTKLIIIIVILTIRGWGRCKMVFLENRAQIATSRGEKNLKPPYVDNRFQNYDLHSLCKGNSKISDFPSFTSCQI
jgi:hypothetical protein